MLVQCRIDTSHFMKAEAVFRRHSRQKPAEHLNRAVFFVTVRAHKNTHSTPISTIDTQLNVITSPAVLKNGKLSTSRKRQNEIVTAVGKLLRGQQGPRMVPRAALIVSAQVLRVDTAKSQPGMSRYNQMTGMRYARMSSPWRGVSRRTGASKMRAAITRLTKSRHSASGFFKASWRGILDMLQAGMPKGYRRNVSGKASPDGMSIATPAAPGLTPTCTIENRMGMSGSSPVLNMSRNAAAHRILAPILQSAIDTEFNNSLVMLDKKGWLESAPELSRYGFVVTV
jgi:hypothetical protein